MRLNRDMKRALENLAQLEKRSLSSLVANILRDYLKEKGIDWEHRERRTSPRKVIEMPARFRIPGPVSPLEQEVFLRDISQTGAYAISEDITGMEKILKMGKVPKRAQLIVQISGLEDPLILKCDIVRISIDRNKIGIGLEYRELPDQKRSIIDRQILSAR